MRWILLSFVNCLPMISIREGGKEAIERMGSILHATSIAAETARASEGSQILPTLRNNIKDLRHPSVGEHGQISLASGLGTNSHGRLELHPVSGIKDEMPDPQRALSSLEGINSATAAAAELGQIEVAAGENARGRLDLHPVSDAKDEIIDSLKAIPGIEDIKSPTELDLAHVDGEHAMVDAASAGHQAPPTAGAGESTADQVNNPSFAIFPKKATGLGARIKDRLSRILKLNQYHPLYFKRNQDSVGTSYTPKPADPIPEHSLGAMAAAAGGVGFLAGGGYELSALQSQNYRQKKQK